MQYLQIKDFKLISSIPKGMVTITYKLSLFTWIYLTRQITVMWAKLCLLVIFSTTIKIASLLNKIMMRTSHSTYHTTFNNSLTLPTKFLLDPNSTIDKLTTRHSCSNKTYSIIRTRSTARKVSKIFKLWRPLLTVTLVWWNKC